MSQGSEAAEQMTREAIQISEAAAKLAALGAKNLAALCLALANENQKLRGKTHMNALLRSGKELRVFDLKEQDLPVFQHEAKQYGVLFSVIKDAANGNGHVDILAKAEDVSKLNRIFERLHYAAPEQVQTEEDPLKKAGSRVPHESRSAERGTGWKPERTAHEQPDSVIARIRQYKIRQAEQKPHLPGKDRER